MERREILGSVVATTLSANISIASSSFSVNDGSSFPTGSLNPFVVVIDRGTADEEKILVESRSTNTFTVKTRGYDGTTAVAHLINAEVDHVLDATSVQSMNKNVFDNSILYWMGA